MLNETILRDRTVNQAAEVLGILVGTIKSRVYYAHLLVQGGTAIPLKNVSHFDVEVVNGGTLLTIPA